MLNKLNNWLKAFLSLNKSEQRGIIFLVILSFIIIVVNLLLPYFITHDTKSDIDTFRNEIDTFIEQQQYLKDSAKIEQLQSSGKIDKTAALHKIKPTIFNPNKLPVEVWKNMGLTDRQISNIKNYEAKGGKFKRKEDLKKIYSISEAEYKILEPYINIPSSYKSKTGRVIKKNKSDNSIILKNIELNTADSVELTRSLGFSSWIARRTISYRNILGGYMYRNQLKEVYGLNDSIYSMIENYIIIDTTRVVKIDINNVEFKDLLKHPYFDYNTTKSIINTRNKIGFFSSINQLKMIESINDSTISRVRDYLYFRPLK